MLRGLVERRGGQSQEQLGEGVAVGCGARGGEGVEERGDGRATVQYTYMKITVHTLR